MKTINITNSWFYSAGTQYGWEGDNFDRRGVGIQATFLRDYPEIEIVVDKISYLLNTKEAIKFVKRFKSYYNAKGIIIGVVSKSILKIKNLKESFKKEKKEWEQLTLF